MANDERRGSSVWFITYVRQMPAPILAGPSRFFAVPGRMRPMLSLVAMAMLLLLGGCAQTLRQQYIDANDPCSSAREPIVSAGDELDARYKQLADQKATQQMQGHELPEVTQYGGQIQVNFANMLANAMTKASLSNQNYIAMKQQETGANAAALLASVEGDASNDRARLDSVVAATHRLRECRGTQILNARTVDGLTEAQRQDKLREQQAMLNKDDELITKVFGQYGQRAQMYADAGSSVATASAPRGGTVRKSKAAPKTSIQAFSEDQSMAQLADRKQSETLHETLQSSLAGS